MAACALSAPLEERNVVYKEVVVTVQTTITGGVPQSTQTTPPAAYVPPPPPPAYTPKAAPAPAPQPQPAPAPAPEQPPAAKPVASPAPAPASGGPTSGGVSLIDTVNKWRKNYGLSTLDWDDQLADNALKTGTDGGGSVQQHELNSGSMAQVITPGQSTMVGDYKPTTPFELSYVAWLCEVQSSQLGDMCDQVSKNLHMEYDGTGHHDILCSQNYQKIGCGFAKNPSKGATDIYQGLWVCDLA